MSQIPRTSVIVCTKNEETRLGECLKSIMANKPDEVLVVDGASTDRTVEIAKQYSTRVIRSDADSLSRDRQLGVDESRNDYVVFVDADHRLKEGDLAGLHRDLIDFNLDIVQSQLKSYKVLGFWDSAEDASWDITHNIPGPKSMIGTAPTLYKKRIFGFVRFDDHVTATIDDTDFIYRLSKFPEIKIGIGRTVVLQEHFSDFKTYVQKFKWYGKGDGEFCQKNPNRAPSMIYHLLIRYPVLHSLKATSRNKFKAVPFFVLQGVVRFYSLLKYCIIAFAKSKSY